MKGSWLPIFSFINLVIRSFSRLLLLASIKILASGNIAKIENISKTEAKDFSEKVREKLSEPKNNEQQVSIVQNIQIDIADQIVKLADLKEKGILTQDEFDQQKQKLLNN